MGKKFSDIKSLINLSLVRLNSVRKKSLDELAHKKRVLAKNLQDGEFAAARLEAERIVKIDWKIESLNLIEIKCEEVRDNVIMLTNQKEVPYDLDEAVSTIIYCNERCEIPELKDVVKVITRKYGKEYVEMQQNNSMKRVDERLVHRLSGQRPNAFLVYNYMKEIAATFGIEWVEDQVTKAMGERFDVPMSAGAPGVGSASGIGTGAYAVTDGRILPKGQKPKGFVPPPKPDLSEIKVAAEVTVVDEDIDDDEGGGEDNEGGETTPLKFEPLPPTAPKAVQSVVEAKPPAEVKPVVKKPAAAPAKKQQIVKKPAPVEKAETSTPPPASGGGFSDLESRFAKLRDL